jgi:hypothetical protein
MHETEKRNVNVGYYVVSLLDVLGQREAVQRLRSLPEGPKGREQALQILCETAGFIWKLRELVKDGYESTATVPQEVWGERVAQKYMGHSVKFSSFSDTMIAYAYLREIGDQVAPINGLSAMLGATAGAMLSTMNLGHCLRGGIEIGVGTDLIENEIYGPALVDAYKLESCDAIFPRVLVGPNVGRFLADMAALPSSTRESIHTARLAKACQEMIVPDTDGLMILDYLGPMLARLGREPAKELVLGAHAFVKKELRRFEQQVGKEKVILKYRYLNQYFESRLHLWA